MRDGEESTYVEAQHWAANLAAESEKMGAMPQERAEPYGSSAGQMTSLHIATSFRGLFGHH
jgi:hypothetical protein